MKKRFSHMEAMIAPLRGVVFKKEEGRGVNDGHQRPYTDEERAAWPYGKPPEAPMGISNGVPNETDDDFLLKRIEQLEWQVQQLMSGPRR